MTTATPPGRRRGGLVTLDIALSVIILFFGLLLGIAVIAATLSFTPLGVVCSSGCAVVTPTVIGMIALTVLLFFAGLGGAIVSMLRRRWSFYWPLGAFVATVIVFWVGTWILGSNVVIDDVVF